MYKQKFENSSADNEFLFVFSFVPLKLDNEQNLAWNYLFCSSTRNCRFLMIMFSKETTDLIGTKTDKIKQVESYQGYSRQYMEVTIPYKFLLVMVKGKICQYY